ncbi:MAG TPA: sialidase family protein, partial [Bacteroidota bacterium]|nr:sialidase family protein [Bacteroidota bacterium]
MLHCLRRGSIVSIVCVIAAMSVPSLTFACQSEWTQGIIKSELVFERAPFKSCHASTIAETPSGLVVAFFAGTREGSADVSIWVSRFIRGTWTPPKEVANGIQSGGEREPCWNPVLFQIPGGRLLLFYKVGPSPSEWWGMMARSTDGGATWSDPQRLPDGILGPIKNKPILLANGVLLAPSSTEHGNWNVHVESTRDEAVTWQRTASIPTDGVMNVIQPTIVTHRDGRLQMLC